MARGTAASNPFAYAPSDGASPLRLMGCLLRLGCLVVLLLAAVVGWITKDRWWPGARTAAVPTWERLSPAGADRTAAALKRLEQPNGPVFVSLTGSDVASYIFHGAGQVLPSFADSAEAAVFDDRLVVRGTVPLRELGGSGLLGPFASMLGDREPMELSGRIRVLQPGQAELRISDVKVRDFALPSGLIPRLLRQAGFPRPDGMSEDGIPVRLPAHVGDVRVADGKITLYKNIP
ncbi:MAG: hypothetical protein H0X64_13310 [Gemmatimonadaceae bacterium]|nr:hypothetical protein [Gemmatimonadaceae bacterium]